MNRDPKNGDGRKVIGEYSYRTMKRTLGKDFREAKEFFLDQERNQRLESMKPIKRWFFTTIWLFRALVLKLNPFRRLLLVAATIMIVSDWNFTLLGGGKANVILNLKTIGGLILLYILLMELKDKLLARDELVAGRSVQEALLPRSDPEIPGWDVWLYSRPANDVGGDLIDYIELKDNRFGVVLGDVSGKGLPAALFMAKLQATLRALVTESPSLPHLGSKMNQIFHRDSVPQSFATLMYVELVSGSGDIRLLNAGHPPSITMWNKKITQTKKGDRALGISSNSQYKENKIHLRKGEYLIIYSDGLTEAQNPQGEFFGMERVLELISATEKTGAAALGTQIIDTVEHFVQDAPRHDDLSLVILRSN